MNILIVEDQPDKKENIELFLHNYYTCSSHLNISTVGSLRGALRALLLCDTYDLILLDMSMPAFDTSSSYFDGSPESYAGHELLEQMKLRGISVPVIVVTQYSSFEGGAVTLEDLSQNFYEEYSKFYFGHVYYNSGNDNWKLDLEQKILGLKVQNEPS
ncbi:response regulator [Wohlfahrtiimonas populi]|uniref:response regulator n=1 Tax=Wohlfahrtiimonas populi TaxID=1940240 RepID=UPI00098D4DAF|nr:response regulator [Wohlfahrtiimonas populi]